MLILTNKICVIGTASKNYCIHYAGGLEDLKELGVISSYCTVRSGAADK